MTAVRSRARGGAPLALLLLSLAGAAAASPVVFLDVDAPAEATAVTLPSPLLEVSGRAGASAAGQDLVIAIDVSASTDLPSGVDVNENGRLGHIDPIGLRERICSDPGDSIRAAELRAARDLVASLVGGATRVGVVVFDERVRASAPLGASASAIEGALATAGETPPRRERTTDFSAALREAGRLFAEAPAIGDTAARRRSVVFLSDGLPTAPVSPERAAEAAAEAASALVDQGVRVHAFALGVGEDEAGPDAFRRVATLTGGELTRLATPGDVVADLRRIDLAGLASLEIENATTGRPARAVRRLADGSFDGFVELAPGENRLRVVATGKDGASRALERNVRWEPRPPRDADDARRIDAELAALHERLRARTAEIAVTAEIERARDERARKELELGVSRETPPEPTASVSSPPPGYVPPAP